ncbi:hypothetical protein [Geoalkalibacter subterraneus]|uniref:hypothetical protein n=1 Tax=Geoalkalibacter subterraneus TaxID=483547 RepID=UPI00130EA492|nr:hypothetical protein [Geoalkalibacter subterraneus]
MEIIRSKTTKALVIGWIKFVIAFLVVAAYAAVAGHEAEVSRTMASPAYVQICK